MVRVDTVDGLTLTKRTSWAELGMFGSFVASKSRLPASSRSPSRKTRAILPGFEIR